MARADDHGRTDRGAARGLLRYVRPHWKSFAAAAACGLVKFLLPFVLAWFVGRGVDELGALAAGRATGPATERLLARLALGALFLAVAAQGAVYLRHTLEAVGIERVILDLRRDLYAHVQKLSHSFFDANRSGALAARVIGDVDALRPVLATLLVQLWMTAATALVVLGFLFAKSAALALVVAATAVPGAIVQSAIARRLKRTQKTLREQTAGLSACAQEKFAGATIVKSFAREEREIAQFGEETRGIVDLGVRSGRLTALSQVSMSFFESAGPILVLVVGGLLATRGAAGVTAGLVTQFILVERALKSLLRFLVDAQITVAGGLASAERVAELFAAEPEVADRPGAIPAPRFEGAVRFEGATFSFPGGAAPALRGLELDVKPRTMLALVGASGAGKTTVLSLLSRFYDCAEGRILVDGRDIRDYTVLSLRSQIGLVAQDAFLFSGTIAENILYGRPDATEDEVRCAAERAHAADFIEALPSGYATEVGERGVKLSVGQRQRIAIARAFLKDPPILLLDEPTSALDGASEGVVQRALEDLARTRTTIVVAHRLSTIRRAHRIAVIDGGRMIECGGHAELLERGGAYADLWEKQFIERTTTGEAA